jgi:hypothetical protein
MLSNPILYRVLTNPFLYQWVLATALPFLLWAELAKIARRDPGIWPQVLPWLKVLAVGLWFSSAAWGFYTLSAPQGKVFYEINAILITLSGGTQLVYGWARQRVDPGANVKERDGWRPTSRVSQEVVTGKNL